MSTTKHNYSITDYSATADYSSPEAKNILLRNMQRQSFFFDRFGAGNVMKQYDVSEFPFRRIITDMLFEKGILPEKLRSNPPPLEKLHEHLSEEQKALDASGVSFLASMFYEVNDTFYQTYNHFLKDYIKQDLFGGEPLIFQKNVTIRFYFPHAKGFNWKPSYHTDIMLGHPPQEINIWFPLTRIYDTNTMRIVSLYDSCEILNRYGFDFKSFAVDVQENTSLQDELKVKSANVEGNYGDILLFDSRCLHTLQENKTDITRVSIDIRVMPVREYNDLEMKYVGTGRQKMPFIMGKYYSDTQI